MRLNLSPNGLKPASTPQIDKFLKASLQHCFQMALKLLKHLLSLVQMALAEASQNYFPGLAPFPVLENKKVSFL